MEGKGEEARKAEAQTGPAWREDRRGQADQSRGRREWQLLCKVENQPATSILSVSERWDCDRDRVGRDLSLVDGDGRECASSEAAKISSI